MTRGSLIGIYGNLLALNSRLFIERFKVDIPLMLMGLFYIFVGESGIEMTVGKGVLLLTGFIFAAVMESQIIRRNTASLSFYLKLPIGRKMTLALLYAAAIVPGLFVFSALFLVCCAILLSGADQAGAASIVRQRYCQVLFAMLFIKSLTINIMIAMSIHPALVAGYLGLLAFLLFILSVLRELIAPIYAMGDFSFVFLFLVLTYLVSFIAVKRIGLR